MSNVIAAERLVALRAVRAQARGELPGAVRAPRPAPPEPGAGASLADKALWARRRWDELHDELGEVTRLLRSPGMLRAGVRRLRALERAVAAACGSGTVRALDAARRGPGEAGA